MYTITQWEQQGHYFQFQGHQIFYRADDVSAKPVLVLIHGFPTSSWDWQYLWDDLSEMFRVITLDMLGFGFSAKPSRHQYSILEQADIVQALLQSLNVSSYHILAHDYGDTVAQELMARDLLLKTPCIESVIMTNGGLFPETHRPVFLQKLLLSPFGGIAAKLSSFAKFKKNFDHICAQKISEDELRTHWALVTRNNGRAVLPKLISYMTERKQYRERWVSALQNFSRPLRLIDGMDDPISGAHMVTRYRELIAQADIVELSGVGHYPQVEAPDQVLKAMLDFWASALA